MRRVDLVVMNGRSSASKVEQMVDGARTAITCDLVNRAVAAQIFASIIVSTNDPDLAETLRDLPSVVVELDPQDEVFHFGRRLQWLIAEHRLERVVYMGGGSAPLLPTAVLCRMVERLCAVDRLFLANNFYSVDFCAFTPASALFSVEPPPNDNSLGWLLGEEFGLPAQELPRTSGTTFDVDTPVDLMILSLHPRVPPRTRAYLNGLALNTRHVEAAIRTFVDRHAEVLISGRVSTRTMALLGREIACRTRIFSEERGMRADGRLSSGKVRSLLGMQMESVGVGRFFAEVIPQLGQAAFLDDRVIWGHQRIWPSANDRYNSDLLCPEAITDPFIRRFTEAALSCPVPVVLGGHSLVSGGLLVLAEAAWARSGVDLQRPVESVADEDFPWE